MINSVIVDPTYATQYVEGQGVLWKRSINWTALETKTIPARNVHIRMSAAHWYHGHLSPARFCLRCSPFIFKSHPNIGRRSKMTQTTLPRHPIENDNPLTGLHGRQRAPLNRLHRCLITQGMSHSTSGTPDEEVDYGSWLMAITRTLSPKP